MYKILEKDDYISTFPRESLNGIGSILNEEISNQIEKSNGKKPKDFFYSGIFHDVKLIGGAVSEVYLEMLVHFYEDGRVGSSITYGVIYDDLPDFILDRYNEQKSLKELLQNQAKLN